MRASQRNKFSGIAVFGLIAVVVMGGMTWATVANLRLTEINIRGEREATIRRTVNLLDSYVPVMLQAEMGRAAIDYVALHAARPLAALEDDQVEFDPGPVVIRSPMAERGPSKKWIEFYFQFDEEEGWTSPQRYRPGLDIPASYLLSAERERKLLDWVRVQLPIAEIEHRISQAVERTQSSDQPGPNASVPDRDGHWKSAMPRRALVRRGWGTSRQGRNKDTIAAQLKSLPSSACAAHIVDDDLGTIAVQDADIVESSHYYSHGVYAAPLATFWLTSKDDHKTKLAFVRTAFRDATRVYQGFICDWDAMKQELLSNTAMDVDLQPILDSSAKDTASDDTALSLIPVRLAIPPRSDNAAAEVWHRMGSGLITSWIAAVLVLGMAGWGIRNLVALTERRIQFAYAVTHELRTPLTTFRLYSDMLSAGLVPEESKQSYLETLNRESIRLAGLVEDVMEYARIENRNVRLNPTDADSQAVLGALRETLEQTCQNYGITPLAHSEIQNGSIFHVDVDIVNRIAGVLINNACRHARGAQDPKILVRLSDDRLQLFVDVIDSGPGIDRSDAKSIFKAFRRGRHADPSAHSGIGLGLALARSWASLLGGHLDLVKRHHDEFGGAHFRLTVPAAPA